MEVYMTDIILINANVITLNPEKPIAQLVAIRKNKIQAVTDNEALKYLQKKHTRVIDCRGKTLIPGFYDTHFHLQASAASLVSLNLSHLGKMQSVLDIQTRIRKFSKNLAPATWIRATGYNDFYLAGRRHPTRWDLDKAAPNHFVKLSHQTRHICVLNSVALSCAGISIHCNSDSRHGPYYDFPTDSLMASRFDDETGGQLTPENLNGGKPSMPASFA